MNTTIFQLKPLIKLWMSFDVLWMIGCLPNVSFWTTLLYTVKSKLLALDENGAVWRIDYRLGNSVIENIGLHLSMHQWSK